MVLFLDIWLTPLDIWLTPPSYMWKIEILYHNLVQKSQLFFIKLVSIKLFMKSIPPRQKLKLCVSSFC